MKDWRRLPCAIWREYPINLSIYQSMCDPVISPGAKADLSFFLLFRLLLVVFGVYVTSFAFVFGTAVLKFGVGLDTSNMACDSAILLCLVAYVSTKVSCFLFFFFMVLRIIAGDLLTCACGQVVCKIYP